MYSINNPDFLEKYEIGRENLDIEIIKNIEFTETLDILEIGAFSGRLLKKIKAIQPTINIYGVDIDSEATQFCKNILPEGQFYNSDFINFVSEQKFDYIIASQVLEHCVNPEIYIFKMLLYLKPNGTCILTVPNSKKDRCMEHCNFWTKESFESFFANIGINADATLFDNDCNIITKFKNLNNE